MAAPKALITNSLSMTLKLIPAGTFWMGSSKDRDPQAYDDEMPRHEVRISRAFYLGVTEVSQGQYRAVTGKSPSYFKGSDDLPVEQVSWNDAITFCNKLSEKERLKPYYQFGAGAVSDGDGYRLPTEAEWEYAARAGPGGAGAYSFGDDPVQLDRYAWYRANAHETTHPVGSRKLPNAFGLFDMHGNVSEWCWDWKAPYEAMAAVDPVGPLTASRRVIRGGSWFNDGEYCRSATRNDFTPSYQGIFVGFRVARVPSGR
jgi:formylglycine-generating enzyme required for sulfatase activity